MPRTMNSSIREDALLSRLALAIGEPARTRILLSLMDGRARTSTELAALAEVTPSTASAHLNRLKDSGLVRVAAEGRHRYYSLKSADVARVLEGLSILAGGTTRKFLPNTPEPLRKARTCYDHMAGAVAVALHDQLLREGWLIHDRPGDRDAYDVSEAGARTFARLGIDIAEVRKHRRKFAYACLDWSERRPHIGGALAAALLKQALAKKWVSRELSSRALCLTRFGEREFLRHLGVNL
jgi:DNA-binding transcriptional ArsR family regulator